MIKKVNSILEGLDEIEIIDKKISLQLEQENYDKILDMMKFRLAYIAEITRLKGGQELSDSLKRRVQEIFDSADCIQEKVKAKRDSVKKRLEGGNKVKTRLKHRF